MRESICESHLHARGDPPDNVEVLEEEGPVSLLTREFVGVFEVGQIFVVSENEDGMDGALQILLPFCQG